MKEKNCKHCGKKIKNCYNTQKYHKECFKRRRKAYYEANKDKIAERKKAYREANKKTWESLSDEEQLELLNKKAKEILLIPNKETKEKIIKELEKKK